MWKFDLIMLDVDRGGSLTASCRMVTGVKDLLLHVGQLQEWKCNHFM